MRLILILKLRLNTVSVLVYADVFVTVDKKTKSKRYFIIVNLHFSVIL